MVRMLRRDIEWQDFEAWLLGEDGKKPKTVRNWMRAVRQMEREGVDWRLFLRRPRDAVRPWLAKKAREGKPSMVRLGQLLLNRLAAYLALRRRRFRGVRWDVDPVPRRRLDPYTEQELAAIRAYAHSRPFTQARRRLLFWFYENTMIRPGELWSVQRFDLDAERCAFNLRQAEKGNDPGWVLLPASAWTPGSPLDTYLGLRDGVAKDSALWVTDTGDAMTEAGLARDVFEARVELGVRLNTNRFRHTRQSLLARLGVPDHHRQAEARHRNPKSTAWYTHTDPEQRRQALRDHGVPGY